MEPVRVQFLGGKSVVLKDCETVGDIMTRVAGSQRRFASDVVVLPMSCGEVLAHDRLPPPEVYAVVRLEETPLPGEECKLNITLHAAAHHRRLVFRALAMLQVVDPGSRWPEDMLRNAARDANQENIVQTLMRVGLCGNDALVGASKEGDMGAVQRLIRAGANVNHSGTAPRSVLTVPSCLKKKEVVQILVDGRADVNQISQNGRHALTEASCRGYKDAVQILLDARADINHASENGWSVLMVASSCGRKEVAQMLIARGAHINYVSRKRQNALTLACDAGYEDVAKILVHAGVIRR